jgi:PA14 domain
VAWDASLVAILPGDILTRAGNNELRHALDWWLALIGGRVGATLPVEWERKGEKMSASLTSVAYPAFPAVTVAETKPGLRCSVYALEKPARVPDFTKLKPVRESIATTLDPRTIEPKLTSFGLLLEGYLDLQTEDWCRLIIESDDGSRVRLNDTLILDNDGRHPPQEAGVVIRAAKGLHPLRIEFFEMSGGSTLKLFLETPDGKVTEITKDSFSH